MKVAVVVLLAVSSLLAGCTDFSDGDDDPLSIQGIDVSAPDVAAGRLGLQVHVALHNGGGRSDPVNVTVRAYDTATGLLVADAHTAAGRLAGDRMHEVVVPLALPRAPSYRLVVDVAEDDVLVHRATVEARNLSALEPNAHDAGLRIAASDFRVLATAGNRSTVRASVALTNEGSVPSRALLLQVKAREDATGLIVDEAWTPVGAVGLDATRLANVTLVMATGHNYAVEVTLWDGDVIVERGEGRVQFAPRSTVPSGQNVVVTTPDLERLRYAEDGADDSARDSPGPAFALAAVGVLAAVAVLRRRRA